MQMIFAPAEEKKQKIRKNSGKGHEKNKQLNKTANRKARYFT